MSSSRPHYHLDLGSLPPLASTQQTKSNSSTAASSPVEATTAQNARFASTESGGLAGLGNTGVQRVGAGSPSNVEYSSRFYPRRARELASEGSSRSMWGPPTASGLSTPLRETIPESPGDDDTFPDLGLPSVESGLPSRSTSVRRSRAGTVPSQFPGIGGNSAQTPTSAKSTRATPSTSPFRTPANSISAGVGVGRSNSSSSTTGRSAFLLSRIRAGSTPQRSGLGQSQTASPFASSLFSSSWNAGRDRASTHSGAQSKDSDDFIKDLADTDVKTLDYLGLADRSPKPLDDFDVNRYLADMQRQQQFANFQPFNRNRYRSFSVNATEKYNNDEDYNLYSGQMTPMDLQAYEAATQALIHQHNLEVQAFDNQLSGNRPRARTAGILDAPATRMWNAGAIDSLSSGAGNFADNHDLQGLTDSVQALQLQSGPGRNSQEGGSDDASRALWLGNIPPSTTTSSLKVIFEPYGKIESVRVLTHKSCGFVNFETLESSVRARSQLNGKEIFPGAGPVRIGFAKAPSASATPNGNGFHPSPSPDPFGHKQAEAGTATQGGSTIRQRAASGATGNLENVFFTLREAAADIVDTVKDFGATEEDQRHILEHLNEAMSFDDYQTDIPAVPEPGAARMHDAPKLRDIRKRIDNGQCSPAEIESIAMQMLPEIAELSSDYLGNTVVQKLFEHCSEQTKEAMLAQIAPHLAEIGVHKNGTWAAQKIIDVARTPAQMSIIVESLRPYAVSLFLDQYGNYVMQCCLKFTNGYNNFIFQAMLSRLWDIAQGRFGARAMRACLESHHASKDHQRMLAAAVALHSVQLATNANGALLLTWFLDTCNFPHRRKVLAPRLTPYLVPLCTHKVAYLTVLKIINQRNEPEARDSCLQALFFSKDDKVLEDILRDQACGATLIFKVLTTPFLEEDMRPDVQESTRRVLLNIKALPNQGYKRLMDEVGLSARASGTAARDSLDAQNPVSKQQNGSAYGQPALPAQPQLGMTGNMGLHQPPGLESYDGAPMTTAFPSTANGTMAAAPMTPQNPMQYQQGMYAGNRPQAYSYTPTAMNDYAAGQSPIDVYRNMAQAQAQAQAQQRLPLSPGMPMMAQPSFAAPVGYGQMLGTNGVGRPPGMWPQQYSNPYMIPPQQQQMQAQAQAQAMMGGGGPQQGRVSAEPFQRRPRRALHRRQES